MKKLSKLMILMATLTILALTGCSGSAGDSISAEGSISDPLTGHTYKLTSILVQNSTTISLTLNGNTFIVAENGIALDSNTQQYTNYSNAYSYMLNNTTIRFSNGIATMSMEGISISTATYSINGNSVTTVTSNSSTSMTATTSDNWATISVTKSGGVTENYTLLN